VKMPNEAVQQLAKQMTRQIPTNMQNPFQSEVGCSPLLVFSGRFSSIPVCHSCPFQSVKNALVDAVHDMAEVLNDPSRHVRSSVRDDLVQIKVDSGHSPTGD
jgi:hypothetical protein